MSNVVFYEKIFYHPVRHVIMFTANDNNKDITCCISREALKDQFSSDDEEPEIIFNKNKLFIYEKTKKIINSGRFEKDGSILLTNKDF